jgi:hypothetical protein
MSMMDTENLTSEAGHERDEQSFTIDITPSWEGQVRMCLMIISGATPHAVSTAQEELLRMGRILDHYAEREASA